MKSPVPDHFCSIASEVFTNYSHFNPFETISHLAQLLNLHLDNIR